VREKRAIQEISDFKFQIQKSKFKNKIDSDSKTNLELTTHNPRTSNPELTTPKLPTPNPEPRTAK